MKKCISVISTIFMVFSLIMIPTNKVYGQADVTAPELKSIKVDKKNVKAGDVVTFTAEVTDDISGVDFVYVYLDISGTNRQQGIRLEKKEDDTYEGSYTINENDPNGTWKIYRVYLSDRQENSTSVYNNGIGETDFSSCDFEVTGNKKVDIMAPELKSIKVDKKNAEAGDAVIFTAEVTDDISGVDFVYVYLDIPGTNRQQGIRLEKKENDTYEGSYTINENDPNGTWKIYRVYLSDRQGNSTSVYNIGEEIDFSSCSFEVKEDDNPIKQISGATVISSNQTLSNKIINGDLYIAPNIALSVNNLTVNGNIYVLGGLLAGNISVSGTVYCNSSTIGYTTTLYPGMFAWYGSCSIYGLTCSNRIVNMIPLRFDEDLTVDANGNLNLKGATLNIADMSINGDDIKLDSKGRFDQTVNVGEADQITITRHIEGWYDLKQTIDVQHEKPESLKIESLPDKTVYQDGDKLVSKGLKVKAIYKNGTEKDVTDYVKLSDINGLGTNKIKVTYRGCETTFDVEVNEIKAESITLDKTNIILEIGKTEQLNPVIKPDNVSNKKVSYETSDNSIASVDNEGKITALKEGNVIITATTSNNLKVECEVQVIKHTHQWNEGQVTKEPSCTEAGEKEYICKTCGEKKTEEIAAKGHEWSSEYTVDKKATCTEKGEESIHCKVCGEIKEGSEKEISATDHQWDKGTVIKEASCTKTGEKEYTCVICGEKKIEGIVAQGHEWSSEYTIDKKATCTEKGTESIHCKVCGAIKEGSEKEIYATGHQWDKGTVTKEASCTKTGEKEYICKICGTKKTEEIAAQGHEWSSEYTVDKKATCTEKGEESIHCKVCGEIKEGSEKEISATEHQWNKGTVIKEASCTKAGEKEYTCETCGAKKTEEIAAKGHEWSSEYIIDKKATCTEKGEESIHCKDCGAIKEGSEKEIPATGHQWDKGTVTKEASCTKTGEKEYICKICGTKKTEEIVAQGHEWSSEYTVDKKATCTEKGEESIHCEVCGAIKEGSQKEISAIGHKWNEGTLTKEAGCTKAGEKEYTCETCGTKKTEEIAAKGHEWSSEYIIDKKVTCTEKGIESIHCKDCGAIKEGSEKEISAKGHQWNKGTVIKEASCTKAGEKEYTCETCGTKKTEEIAAQGHEWSSEYTVDKKATCIEKGIESIHCKVCGAIKEGSEKEISATGHQWDKGTVIKEPSCTKAGEKEHTCETCGAKKTEEIAPTGHKWNTNYTIDKKATCEHQGTKSIHCVNCNEIKDESTVIIPAYNHSKTEIRNAKKATYTSDGYTGDTYCKLCGKKLRSGKKIKKLVAKIPQKVTISKLAAGKKKFKVTYKKAKDATKYQIQYSLNKNMKSAKVKTTKNLTYTISNLKAKKVYYIRVKAINIQGKSGSWSQIKQVKTK